MLMDDVAILTHIIVIITAFGVAIAFVQWGAIRDRERADSNYSTTARNDANKETSVPKELGDVSENNSNY